MTVQERNTKKAYRDANAQVPLMFNSPLPFQRHSETSREAAEAARDGAATQRARVLEWFRQQPEGAADFECIAAFGGLQSVRPRRIELQGLGVIRDSGRKKLTPSGRQAVVWEAVK